MIKVHLNKYIEKYNLNISQLSKETGISRKALTLLANYNDSEDKPVSIQYNTIEILCEYFKIGIDNLISYEYDIESFTSTRIVSNVGEHNDISIFIIYYITIINNKETIHYFPVTVRIDKNEAPTEYNYEIPKPFWGETDDNKIQNTEKKTALTPGFVSYNFEVVLNKFSDKINKYFVETKYDEFLNDNNIVKLSDEEIASIMKSFSKTFLAELTIKLFNNIFHELYSETEIEIKWNFGYYSFMNSNSFTFRYSKTHSTIISMDDDNLVDPFDSMFSNVEGSLMMNTYPNTFML